MTKTVDLPKVARLLDELSILTRDNKAGKVSDKETLECVHSLIEQAQQVRNDLWNWLV